MAVVAAATNLENAAKVGSSMHIHRPKNATAVSTCLYVSGLKPNQAWKRCRETLDFALCHDSIASVILGIHFGQLVLQLFGLPSTWMATPVKNLLTWIDRPPFRHHVTLGIVLLDVPNKCPDLPRFLNHWVQELLHLKLHLRVGKCKVKLNQSMLGMNLYIGQISYDHRGHIEWKETLYIGLPPVAEILRVFQPVGLFQQPAGCWMHPGDQRHLQKWSASELPFGSGWSGMKPPILKK